MKYEIKYEIKLESFTGPLDLLIHLIEKEEIDIYHIPLAQITEEYIDYLETSEEFDLEKISEFLLMALNLLQIKAALLLPETKAVQESREEAQEMKKVLMERLLEYRKFKKSAEILSQWEALEKKIFSREQEESLEEERELGEISLDKLVGCLQKMIKQRIREELTQVVILEEITLEQRMEQILAVLKTGKEPVDFADFFSGDRNNLVTTFLALLELVKLRKIRLRQESPFTLIQVTTWVREEEAEDK